MSAQVFPVAAEERIKQEGINRIRIFSNIPKGKGLGFSVRMLLGMFNTVSVLNLGSLGLDLGNYLGVPLLHNWVTKATYQFLI
ncbi:hypothetical protein GQ457_01G022620 [Hibiscus cannabinus]